MMSIIHNLSTQPYNPVLTTFWGLSSASSSSSHRRSCLGKVLPQSERRAPPPWSGTGICRSRHRSSSRCLCWRRSATDWPKIRCQANSKNELKNQAFERQTNERRLDQPSRSRSPCCGRSTSQSSRRRWSRSASWPLRLWLLTCQLWTLHQPPDGQSNVYSGSVQLWHWSHLLNRIISICKNTQITGWWQAFQRISSCIDFLFNGQWCKENLCHCYWRLTFSTFVTELEVLNFFLESSIFS